METTDPCSQCKAHDQLKEDFENTNRLNSNQHNDILSSIDLMAGNINWMNIIGKWVLAAMLSYFIGIAAFLFTCEYATPDDITKIEKTIKEGEILHYKNELVIGSIETKLDILTKYAEKADR